MKTIYKCDVCGKEFSDWETCSEHEKLCKETHATGYRLTEEIDRALRAAKESGDVKVALCIDDNGTAYNITGVRYLTPTRKVILDVDADEPSLIPSKEGSANA